MMGAQNARTLVKNQWRTKTTSSVFLVRIHVWLTIAPAMVAVSALDGYARSGKVVWSRWGVRRECLGRWVVNPTGNYSGKGRIVPRTGINTKGVSSKKKGIS